MEKIIIGQRILGVVGEIKLEIVFSNEKLKDEFFGWLIDGGGENSFNLGEHLADFSYVGKDTIIVKSPNQ